MYCQFPVRDESGMTTPTSDRLILREWCDDDLGAFADINADARVMEHFPKMLSREESDAVAVRIRQHFAEHGFGLWAVEVPGAAAFIGFVGLSTPKFDAHFTPSVEIGWRLAQEHWNQGYATEAAGAALAFGFSEIGLPEVVSFTAMQNLASRRVMEKLGMSHDASEDFDHPLLAAGDPLQRHVLYRLDAANWRSTNQGALTHQTNGGK